MILPQCPVLYNVSIPSLCSFYQVMKILCLLHSIYHYLYLLLPVLFWPFPLDYKLTALFITVYWAPSTVSIFNKWKLSIWMNELEVDKATYKYKCLKTGRHELRKFLPERERDWAVEETKPGEVQTIAEGNRRKSWPRKNKSLYRALSQ